MNVNLPLVIRCHSQNQPFQSDSQDSGGLHLCRYELALTVDVNDAQLTQSFAVRRYPALPLERVLELMSR